MIEIRIPKEIRQYKEKAFWGLTWRQILALILAGGINVPLYLWLTPLLGADITSWIIMLIAAPVMMAGFWEPYGMHFEDFLVAVVKSMLIYPEKRLYKTENLYEIILNQKVIAKARPSLFDNIIYSISRMKAKQEGYYEESVITAVTEKELELDIIAEQPAKKVEVGVVKAKPKPIILHGLISIAVFSVSPGAGATTMAISLAEYLAKFGKTAAVGADGKIDLSFAKGKADYFIVDGTNLGSVMYDLTRDGYKYVVADYGSLFDIDSSGQINYTVLPGMRDLLLEFFKSGIKIGMGLSSPWHLDKFKFFMDGDLFSDKITDGSYHFLFDKDVKSMKFRYGFKQIYNRSELNMEQLFSILVPEWRSK